MDVPVTPELEQRLRHAAAVTGRAPAELVEEALDLFLDELTALRSSLNARYDELQRGLVQGVDGEEAKASLRQRSQERRSRT